MTEVVRDFSTIDEGKDVRIITWTGLLGTDSGKAVDLAGYPDQTVHIYGTFDSGTVTMYGSNDPLVLVDRLAGTLFGSKTASWIGLVNAHNDAIARTSANLDLIAQHARFVCPVVTGGGGSAALKVVITASRNKI